METAKMYRVEVRLEWESPENNSDKNDVVAYCPYLADAEAVWDYRTKRAMEEKHRFEERGGYKTCFVCLIDPDHRMILQRYF